MLGTGMKTRISRPALGLLVVVVIALAVGGTLLANAVRTKPTSVASVSNVLPSPPTNSVKASAATDMPTSTRVLTTAAEGALPPVTSSAVRPSDMPVMAPAPSATANATPATAADAPVLDPSSADQGGLASTEPAPVLTAAGLTRAAAGAVPDAATLEATRILPSASGTPTVTLPSTEPCSLQISVMRQQAYPGSAITVEQTLPPGANYSRHVVSYLSDGFKIFALMTVPNGPRPETGWPAIIFNHGFIPPAQYRTTERYVAYVDAIAQGGYIVFKPDYRGHGSSEGPPEGAYGTPGYTDDVLNALASVRAYPAADPRRIGMWGHSLGGSLTLRAMVVSTDIKAGVIWGGVVAPYPNVFARVADPSRPTPVPRATPVTSGGLGPFGRPWRQELTAKYGTLEQNPGFWASISPNSFLADISGPLELHHSITDESVPVAASQTLHAEMLAAGKPVDLYTYPGDNHNISRNFATAMQRTVAFFDKFVKGS